MRPPIPKYLFACIIVSLLSFEHTFAQCPAEIQYSLEKNQDNSFSIYLKAQATTPLLKIQLYDLFTGKVLAEKEINSLTTASREVFTNVPPSRYSIIIRAEHCEKPTTLGGIYGISIGIPD